MKDLLGRTIRIGDIVSYGGPIADEYLELQIVISFSPAPYFLWVQPVVVDNGAVTWIDDPKTTKYLVEPKDVLIVNEIFGPYRSIDCHGCGKKMEFMEALEDPNDYKTEIVSCLECGYVNTNWSVKEWK